MTRSLTAPASFSGRCSRVLLASLAGLLGTGWGGFGAADAVAQTIVYRPIVTGFAPAAGPYVANYNPSGNYAAAAPTVAAYAPTSEFFSPVSGPVAVTSFYAPSYAPAYAPTAVMAPVAMAPTVQMVPTAVAVPLYRRGPFGGLRPVRGASWPAY